ncbi:FtsX-like permease family protein [Caldibacillus debilis]|uniref:FtsX-like permease family protein n=1 Tax=Caldibacillus debilis TaxID=301148 RepID=UPI0023F28426|nr:FtsX-like permease family protein [Caldibacillus debilis]
MKAIGAKNGFLCKSVISQVSVLSLSSIIVGILLTYGTAAIMPQGMPFRLDVKLVFTYSLILLAISLLSSLVSVRTITKIDPLKALGRME